MPASPTEYQRELMTILIDECAEVTQRATKLLRFGIDEVQPGQGLDNKQRLAHEIGELQQMIDICTDAGLIDEMFFDVGRRHKVRQLEKHLVNRP